MLGPLWPWILHIFQVEFCDYKAYICGVPNFKNQQVYENNQWGPMAVGKFCMVEKMVD